MTVITLRSDPLEGFILPDHLEAGGPPESRGVDRDGVRLMVTGPDRLEHLTFRDLPSVLNAGDLLVVNNSLTRPASVRVSRDLQVHFSTLHPGGYHIVEPRAPAGMASERLAGVDPGKVSMPGGGRLELLAPYPVSSTSRRLWLAHFEAPHHGSLDDYLDRWGQPIRYPYVDAPYPLSTYQTVFGTVVGSAEMPSAARPFSVELVTELVNAGVAIAPVTLHTGVSSLESNEAPYPEWFDVAPSTAAMVNHTRERGGRVIAVGTTVVRALESTVDKTGTVHPARGITDLVIEGHEPTSSVDGLITGWHEPESTHLQMLEALAGRPMLSRSYSEALQNSYLWHEFGDSLLLLSGRIQ